MTGRLTVVGTGLRAVGQLTIEALAAIRRADLVLHLTTDAVADAVLDGMRPGASRSLRPLYVDGRRRRDIYRAMVEEILAPVHDGRDVCVAFYGHPGVYAMAGHEAIRRARAEGYDAVMLPGISAEDCLVADLGIDPARPGCSSFEATDFLLHDHPVDPSVHLLLWQVDALGDWQHRPGRSTPPALGLLVDKLARVHPRSHRSTVYAAAMFPGEAPEVVEVALERLTGVAWRPSHTLYVPPSAARRRDPDTAAAFAALGNGA